MSATMAATHAQLASGNQTYRLYFHTISSSLNQDIIDGSSC